MRIKESNLSGGRKVYRKLMNENTVINIYCFLCGFVIALMIAVARGF